MADDLGERTHQDHPETSGNTGRAPPKRLSLSSIDGVVDDYASWEEMATPEEVVPPGHGYEREEGKLGDSTSGSSASTSSTSSLSSDSSDWETDSDGLGSEDSGSKQSSSEEDGEGEEEGGDVEAEVGGEEKVEGGGEVDKVSLALKKAEADAKKEKKRKNDKRGKEKDEEGDKEKKKEGEEEWKLEGVVHTSRQAYKKAKSAAKREKKMKKREKRQERRTKRREKEEEDKTKRERGEEVEENKEDEEKEERRKARKERKKKKREAKRSNKAEPTSNELEGVGLLADKGKGVASTEGPREESDTPENMATLDRPASAGRSDGPSRRPEEAWPLPYRPNKGTTKVITHAHRGPGQYRRPEETWSGTARPRKGSGNTSGPGEAGGAFYFPSSSEYSSLEETRSADKAAGRRVRISDGSEHNTPRSPNESSDIIVNIRTRSPHGRRIARERSPRDDPERSLHGFGQSFGVGSAPETRERDDYGTYPDSLGTSHSSAGSLLPTLSSLPDTLETPPSTLGTNFRGSSAHKKRPGRASTAAGTLRSPPETLASTGRSSTGRSSTSSIPLTRGTIPDTVSTLPTTLGTTRDSTARTGEPSIASTAASIWRRVGHGLSALRRVATSRGSEEVHKGEGDGKDSEMSDDEDISEEDSEMSEDEGGGWPVQVNIKPYQTTDIKNPYAYLPDLPTYIHGRGYRPGSERDDDILAAIMSSVKRVPCEGMLKKADPHEDLQRFIQKHGDGHVEKAWNDLLRYYNWAINGKQSALEALHDAHYQIRSDARRISELYQRIEMYGEREQVASIQYLARETEVKEQAKKISELEQHVRELEMELQRANHLLRRKEVTDEIQKADAFLRVEELERKVIEQNVMLAAKRSPVKKKAVRSPRRKPSSPPAALKLKRALESREKIEADLLKDLEKATERGRTLDLELQGKQRQLGIAEAKVERLQVRLRGRIHPMVIDDNSPPEEHIRSLRDELEDERENTIDKVRALELEIARISERAKELEFQVDQRDRQKADLEAKLEDLRGKHRIAEDERILAAEKARRRAHKLELALENKEREFQDQMMKAGVEIVQLVQQKTDLENVILGLEGQVSKASIGLQAAASAGDTLVEEGGPRDSVPAPGSAPDQTSVPEVAVETVDEPAPDRTSAPEAAVGEEDTQEKEEKGLDPETARRQVPSTQVAPDDLHEEHDKPEQDGAEGQEGIDALRRQLLKYQRAFEDVTRELQTKRKQLEESWADGARLEPFDFEEDEDAYVAAFTPAEGLALIRHTLEKLSLVESDVHGSVALKALAKECDTSLALLSFRVREIDSAQRDMWADLRRELSAAQKAGKSMQEKVNNVQLTLSKYENMAHELLRDKGSPFRFYEDLGLLTELHTKVRRLEEQQRMYQAQLARYHALNVQRLDDLLPGQVRALKEKLASTTTEELLSGGSKGMAELDNMINEIRNLTDQGPADLISSVRELPEQFAFQEQQILNLQQNVVSLTQRLKELEAEKRVVEDMLATLLFNSALAEESEKQDADVLKARIARLAERGQNLAEEKNALKMRINQLLSHKERLTFILNKEEREERLKLQELLLQSLVKDRGLEVIGRHQEDLCFCYLFRYFFPEAYDATVHGGCCAGGGLQNYDEQEEINTVCQGHHGHGSLAAYGYVWVSSCQVLTAVAWLTMLLLIQPYNLIKTGVFGLSVLVGLPGYLLRMAWFGVRYAWYRLADWWRRRRNRQRLRLEGPPWLDVDAELKRQRLPQKPRPWWLGYRPTAAAVVGSALSLGVAFTMLAFLAVREERNLWIQATDWRFVYLGDIYRAKPYPGWSPINVDFRLLLDPISTRLTEGLHSIAFPGSLHGSARLERLWEELLWLGNDTFASSVS